LSHNGPINDLKVMPDSNKDVFRFATGSSDKTIRIWNYYDYQNAELKEKIKRNIYCKELEKIIYTSEKFEHFKDIPQTQSSSDEEIVAEKDPTSTEKSIKVLSISPDGNHIASGDFMGYIRIYDSNSGEELKEILAHD